MVTIDTSTGFGERAERRLRGETIGWLTTVGSDGTPQPSPVWFLWDGETVLVYRRPGTPKLRNIERNGRVSLNLDGDGRGGDIIVLTGEARIDAGAPRAHAVADYLAKYREHIARIGMTPETFGEEYSVAIRMTPAGLRGH